MASGPYIAAGFGLFAAGVGGYAAWIQRRIAALRRARSREERE